MDRQQTPHHYPADKQTARKKPFPFLTAVLATVAGLAVLIAGGGYWVLYTIGPSFGVWWPTPSPTSYAERALDLMDAGLYANGAAWEQAREKAELAATKAENLDQVDKILTEAITVAGGKHSFILSAAETKEIANDYIVPTAEHDGCILTLQMPEFMGTAELGKQYANTVADALDSDQWCGVIVDLRDNGGGDMGPMLAGLSAIFPDGRVSSFKIGASTSDVTLTKGAIFGGGTPTSVGQRKKLSVPVAVLTSEKTASSGEQTLLAFRGLKDVRTFGQPTRGYASVNQTFTLPTGRLMALTVGTTVARTGEEFAEQPIAPDVTTPVDEAHQAAVEWIKSLAG